MAIPDYPITRGEQYLDAIATNDTSALPAEPITRTEQYLDAIARNGGPAPSGGGVLVVHADADTGALDKTWQEINDADFAVMKVGVGFTVVAPAVYIEAADESEYVVVFADIAMGGTITYYQSTATSADGYPVLDMGG